MEACVLWCVLVGTLFLDRAKQKSEVGGKFFLLGLVTTRVSLWETTKEHAKRPNRVRRIQDNTKAPGRGGRAGELGSRQIHPREFGIA
jgi:hypothetical protein